MKKTAGYFFEGSNPGGLTTQAWRLRPSAERVGRSETSPISTSFQKASLTWVTAEAAFPSEPTLQISGARESELAEKKSRRPSWDTVSPEADPPRQISAGFPSRPTRKIAA